jgi:HD-GYP domain-containing protein (c-di-GMP phosphodiesterase class II)
VTVKAPRWRALDRPSSWPPGGDEAAIAVLLDLAEETAPDVAAHMDRTARLARLFGLEVGLSDPLHQLVVRTARLHDIGKLAIPPWVREKPGPLSDTERRIMRSHPVTGQTILERKPSLMGLGALVRATHERWDGNGYPDRLKGSAIPLPSRIVAVCDAFDAMTTNRRYRPAISVPKAVEELRRGAGTQFDPGVVEPFCALFENRIDRWAEGA